MARVALPSPAAQQPVYFSRSSDKLAWTISPAFCLPPTPDHLSGVERAAAASMVAGTKLALVLRAKNGTSNLLIQT